MKVTFLEAKVPLTKTFKLENGELIKIGHPRIIEYTSHEAECNTIEDLFEQIKHHAALNHCFLKGNPTRPLINESRAHTTDPNAETMILLLDFDGIKGFDSPDTLLASLGLAGVDYIIQYSSSMGVIPERGFSAHIWILLDKRYMPALLKQWLIHVNLHVPTLRASLGLTRTNNALRWSLDVTTCQNDKLIYIAPPILEEGVVDHFKGERIQLVKKDKRYATLPTPFPNAETNKIDTEAALNELRLAAGLCKRKPATYKSAGTIEYMAKPDRAYVTGIKRDRNFVYLNLNGGDSWGYYHPENNPEFIYNFKHEPVFKTSELLPEYWATVRTQMNETKVAQDGTIYLAFRDFKTAVYWNGIYRSDTKTLDLAQARSETQLRHFLQQHGQPVGDFVPDWQVEFNPHSEVVVNTDAKVVNMYQPSMYMRMAPRKVSTVPPTIRKVIYHACGEDDEAYERFLNWIACIVQYKTRTGTAWVFHGTQGTGKGLMINYILAPILGRDYVVTKRMEELDSPFNGYMEQCFLLLIDEAQLSEFRRATVMNASLKNYIVEPTISIRRMHTNSYTATNFMNLVFASNVPDPVIIEPEDRRFNVAVFQPTKLEITPDEIRMLEDELMDFYGYLMTRPADQDLARLPLNNEAKRKMAHIQRAGIDLACEALLAGDYQFFDVLRPNVPEDEIPRAQYDAAMNYVALLDKIEKGLKHLLREELFTLLDYAVGSMPASPYKFTSLLKHHKIHIGPVSRDGKTFRGLRVKWNIDHERKPDGTDSINE